MRRGTHALMVVAVDAVAEVGRRARRRVPCTFGLAHAVLDRTYNLELDP